MTTKDFVRQVWDNQFWIRANQPLKQNDIYRVKFDYRADISGEVSTQIHREPADWAGNWLGSKMQFTNDWQTYSNFDSPTTVGTEFQSLTFNLSEIHDANTYYFDNFSFDLYEPQIDVQYSENASIQILFPYYVNTCRLLLQHAGGKRRLLLPNETFTVTINGKTAELLSVEIDATGALMIFIDEDWAADNDCDYVAKTTQELEEEAEGSGEEFAAQEPIIGGSGFNQVIEIKDITVTDGKLVIGAQYAGDSQYFFHKIRLLINNTATDFDYKKAYDELVTNINKPETETAKVRALQLYDLNGRRIVTAQKGIQIVKKMMSDGTVKTQKVIK